MNVKIILGSDNFWKSLEKDISEAEENIYVQVMTYEGDSAGIALSEAIMRSKAKDRRLLIDSFTKYVLSDQFIYTPMAFFNAELQKEIRVTKKLFKKLQNNGTQIKFTNPVDPLFIKYPSRNHKKIITVDHKICYLGGINFSDHNFEWHDMMIRYENEELCKTLEQDFLDTWEMKNNSMKKTIGPLDLYFCDGGNSKDIYKDIFKIIADAQESVYVHSPYITSPCLDVLKQVDQKGVPVTMITSENNNKPILKYYIINETKDTNIDLRLLPGTNSHLKAMLIDDKYLITGSSNFDFASYHLQQEIIIITKDQETIRQFKDKILTPDFERTKKLAKEAHPIKGTLSTLAIKIADLWCRLIQKIV